MADLGRYFTPALGKADPRLRDGIANKLPMGPASDWKYVSKNSPDIKPGWYLDRFYCLFNTGLAVYERCLASWSFLLPDDKERTVIGVNAYGSLLVLQLNHNEAGQVGVLDTTRATFETSANWSFFPHLFSQLLPERLLGTFCDDSVYAAWRKEEKRQLKVDEILGIRIPLPLGGPMTLANFSPENIFTHYESRAEIYKKAHSKLSKVKKAKR